MHKSYKFCFPAISDERLNFLRQNYEAEKAKILQTYENDMNDYKTKKFRMQKELESVYYGLAERSLKITKTAEEEFLQKSDELRNSVSCYTITRSPSQSEQFKLAISARQSIIRLAAKHLST